jgi:hypothetical protein
MRKFIVLIVSVSALVTSGLTFAGQGNTPMLPKVTTQAN